MSSGPSPIGFYSLREAKDLTSKDFPQKSKLAIQMTSKGGLLSERVTSREVGFLRNIPLVGMINTQIAERTVKKEYVQEMRKKFMKDATKNGLSEEGASDLFDRHVEPALLSMPVDQIPGFEAFTSKKPGLLFFTTAYTSISPELRNQEIQRNVLRCVQGLMMEGKNVDRLFNLYDQTEDIFDELSDEDIYHMLDTCMKDIDERGENRKKGIETKEETTLDRYQEFIGTVKKKNLKKPLRKQAQQARGNIIKLALTKKGHKQVMQALNTPGQTSTQIVNTLNQLVASNAQQNAANLQLAFALMPRVGKAMGEMSQDQEMAYMRAWAQTAGELDQSQFDRFLQRFTEHLVLMETLKAEIPRATKLQIIESSGKELESQFPAPTRRLNFVMREMMTSI